MQTLTVLGRELYVGLPKSDSGRRLIALDQTTVQVLAEHQLEQQERAWAIGREGAQTDLVFAKLTGHRFIRPCSHITFNAP